MISSLSLICSSNYLSLLLFSTWLPMVTKWLNPSNVRKRNGGSIIVKMKLNHTEREKKDKISVILQSEISKTIGSFFSLKSDGLLFKHLLNINKNVKNIHFCKKKTYNTSSLTRMICSYICVKQEKESVTANLYLRVL